MQRVTHALIQGREYEINTSFRVALRCSELANNPNVDDYEKSIGVVTMLFGVDCPVCDEALKKAEIFLTAGDGKGDETPLLDYQQDWGFIYSAFKSQYGVDLDTENLHFEQFVDMLKSLKGQVINDVVHLRGYDLKEVKDPSQRRKIVEAQQKVALKCVEEKPSKSAFLQAYKGG